MTARVLPGKPTQEPAPTDIDLDRLARAIMREASVINSPQIQDDVQKRYSTSMTYARRYAAAVVAELRAMEAENIGDG